MNEDKYEGFVKPKDGRLTFHSQVEDDKFRQFLDNFEGENLWIEVNAKRPARTARQNRFYWVYLEKLSSHTGHEPEELHNYFKYEFLEPEIKHGIKKKYKEPPSTTNLTKKEFSDYIRKIEMETGVSAPSRKRYGLGRGNKSR